MNELPKGWAVSSLSDVSNVVRGITFPASAKENSHTKERVCCLRTSNIQREVEWDDIYFVDRSFVKRNEQFVQPGDVLMSMANSYELVGKVAIAKTVPYPTAFGAFLSAIRPTSVIDGLYLFHLLRTSRVQSELRQGSSQTTNIANISVGTLANIEVPLAPLSEQKRIADKLDSTLARVKSCRDRLDRLPVLLKRFRQSILAAATSGRLTEDWRDANPGEPEWQDRPLSELTLKVTDGEHATPKRTESGKYLLSARNVRDGAIALDNVDYVDDDEFARIRKRCDPSIGDVLLSCSGSVGRTALVDKDDAYVMVRSAALLRPKKNVLSEKYLMYGLQSPYLQGQIQDKSSATAQANIFLGAIKTLLLPVPSITEQNEIVRRVETLFAFADRLEARYSTARKQVEQLPSALLAKAFRGELVPQDPNDEHASELLKRLAESRTDVPKPRRGRKAAT